ncbi:hypothetical protein PV327_008597 [Microctonus hyperodae]|uniref:Chitin-binding type-2 domain-containing protein n=1 Tax=Microctonus hyperodae TaxID=165561 RepID=A0AA39F3H4_MICHY|nr:hypothetical protein PV327_008597 [Microctonus hyperodae]
MPWASDGTHKSSHTGLDNLRKSLKEINPVLQFVVSINDARGTLKTSANSRQEAVARIVNIFNEVDGVELNVTAGTKERLVHFIQGLKDEMTRKSMKKRIIIQLPTKAEELAKQFNIKGLSKFVDLFTIPTHYLMDNNDKYKTFHPSRLMGLFDLLNTDSLVDLVHGLGAAKRKILISLPASGYKFTLKIKDKNTAGDNTEEEIPGVINRRELCDFISKGEWTIERDEDLTAPYAFQNNTWIAFEDKISAGIKGKYVLLRDLAGVSISDIENDRMTDCGKSLTDHIYHSFTDNKRKSREAVLSALQDDIYNTEKSYPNNLKSSDFRISRVVDIDGKIHSIRENTQTEFSCNRQGYFVHPKSCNRFYRCVKFNQEIENYSVFEFDCPAGLAFDEQTEVCVWPGSLPEGSPCPGSPEIAPTAARRFREGGYGGHGGDGGYDGHGGDGGYGGHGGDGGYGGHEGDDGYGGHGGYDKSNKGGHGGGSKGGHDGHDDESSHGGNDNSGHGGSDDGSHSHDGNNGYDYPSKGGHDEGSQEGHDESGHDGHDDGSHSHGEHDGYDESNKDDHSGGSKGGHGGYDDGSSNNGHGGYGESGHDDHSGHDESKKGEHDGEFPHGDPGVTKHPNYDDESSQGGFEDSGHHNSDAGSSHDDHGGHEESGHDGQIGHDGYDESHKETHDEGYPHGGPGGYDESNNNEHDHNSSNDGHEILEHHNDDEGYDKSHDEESSHGGSNGHEDSGQGEYDKEVTSGAGYDDHGGYGDKNQGGYDDSSNKNGHPNLGDTSQSGGGYDGQGIKGQVTQSDYGKTDGLGGYATSSYTTSSGHSTISHNGYSPSDGGQYTTSGGAYTKKYPGPPTIIIGSEGAGNQYTTAGQSYSNAGQTTGQQYYTGGNINSGFTSSIGSSQTGFSSKTNSGYSTASVYRGDGATPSGFIKGVTNPSFGNQGGTFTIGVTQPGFIQSQPGTSGYVVTNGVKTIYDGTAVPQTSLYDTSSPGLSINGQTPSGIISNVPTGASGIYIGHPGAPRDSTVDLGNGYYTNHATGGYTNSIAPKGGITFAPTGSTVSPGNQYYTNQAGSAFTSGLGVKGNSGAFTPDISLIQNGNNYYDNNQPGFNLNIGTSSTTDFTPATSVTSPGNRYYTNQAGVSTDNNREVPIKSTINDGYKTNEYYDNGGRGTIRYNNGVVTHKYTEDDVRDHRTSFRIPPAAEVTQSNLFTTNANGVYTKEGFTKTGPTKTGITTAQLGGTGTYIAGVNTVRPIVNTDHIGENAFGTINKQKTKTNNQQSNIFTYSYDNTALSQSSNAEENSNIPTSSQSPLFNIHVYNTPTISPSAPITDSPANVNTYSYANPMSIQYQENMYQSSKSSSNTASTGLYSNPFFTAQRTYPTVSPTVKSVGYTTAPLDNYKTTVFEAARIPAAVSTVKPILDNGYKSVISSTSIPKPVENVNYNDDYKDEDTGLINSEKNSDDQFLNVGLSFPQSSSTSAPFSTGVPGYFSSQQYPQNLQQQRITPLVNYQQSTNEEEDTTGNLDFTYDRINGDFGERINQGGSLSKGSISYQQSNVNIPKQVYQRPSTVAPLQPVENYRQDTSPVKGNVGGGYNYPKPNEEFIKSSTPKISYSTVRPIESNVSPANPLINRNEVEKLVTNYNNRGSVKFTARGDFEDIRGDDRYDNEKSSGKIASLNRDYTTSQPRVTTYSGGYKRISTTPRYEVNKLTDVGHTKDNRKVIVKFSDLHPILLGKLGAECTCKADPFASFKSNKPLLIDSSNGKIDLRNYDESDVYVDLENNREIELQNYKKDSITYQSTSPKTLSRVTPVVAVFNGVKSAKSQSRRPSSSYLPASTPCPSPPSLHYLPSTTSSPLRVSASDIEASASYSSGSVRSRSGKSLDSSNANKNTLSTIGTSSIDHMDPDEIGVLEMSAEGEAKCARPGLFRHPKYCNKFYVCHWDEWKKKFTLHIFKCPIHLTFDNRASACNWPSKGPACQDDNILV